MQKTKLGLFDFTMIVVSLVIGMGIFRTPVNVAQNSATVFIFFATWITGGVIALCGALSYAEIGSRLPVTGAYYKIFSYGYHPSIAFAINCIILISNAASLAAVALVGAEYISTVLFPGDMHVQTAEISIAIGAIALFYGVNLLGLKMSARAQNVLTVIKISMILLLITPLFFAAPVTAHAAPLGNAVPDNWMDYLKGFGKGLVAVSFTCGGYQQTINFGADVGRPTKNIPRGIFFGILIILLLYVSVNYAYIKVIGLEQLRDSKGIAAVMASHIFGAAAGKIVSVLLFLSVLAYVNVLLMSNPRVMYAMSEDGVLPAICAQKNKKTQVLVPSLSIFACLSMLIVFWAKKFDEILSFTIFLDCIGMAASVATIFVLRKKNIKPEGTIFTVKLYPVVPLIFIAAYAFIALSIFNDQPKTALTGLAVLGSFILIYFLSKKRISVT